MIELGGEKPQPQQPEPVPFVTHHGRDEDTGTEFLVTTYEDGLVTLAVRATGDTSWSPQHALTERKSFEADGSEVAR